MAVEKSFRQFSQSLGRLDLPPTEPQRGDATPSRLELRFSK